MNAIGIVLGLLSVLCLLTAVIWWAVRLIKDEEYIFALFLLSTGFFVAAKLISG